MADIIPFKVPYVSVSAVCTTCEQSWTTELKQSRYTDHINKNQNSICPHCLHPTVGYARIYGTAE